MRLQTFLQKIRWWPTILVTAAILWLTLAPHPLPENDVQWFEGADKVVHGIMFFGLASVFMLDLSDYKMRLSYISLLWATIAVIAFSAIDEWAQSFMQLGRVTDPVDFAADIAGIIIAALCAACLIRRK